MSERSKRPEEFRNAIREAPDTDTLSDWLDEYEARKVAGLRSAGLYLFGSIGLGLAVNYLTDIKIPTTDEEPGASIAVVGSLLSTLSTAYAINASENAKATAKELRSRGKTIQGRLIRSVSNK